jgi:recombination protein RecR
MEFPSQIVENAVREISKLPGIGKKSAFRIALHLLKKNKNVTEDLLTALQKLRFETVFCKRCHVVSDKELCNICGSAARDTSLICVVEDVRDLLAVENTGQYRGLYHVLGGLISPLDGITPEQLHLQSLFDRIKTENIKEIILAVSATIEGDTTTFYIQKKLQDSDVKISSIARGVPVGGQIEYADEITLARSISQRILLEK